MYTKRENQTHWGGRDGDHLSLEKEKQRSVVRVPQHISLPARGSGEGSVASRTGSSSLV